MNKRKYKRLIGFQDDMKAPLVFCFIEWIESNRDNTMELLEQEIVDLMGFGINSDVLEFTIWYNLQNRK